MYIWICLNYENIYFVGMRGYPGGPPPGQNPPGLPNADQEKVMSLFSIL